MLWFQVTPDDCATVVTGTGSNEATSAAPTDRSYFIALAFYQYGKPMVIRFGGLHTLTRRALQVLQPCRDFLNIDLGSIAMVGQRYAVLKRAVRRERELPRMWACGLMGPVQEKPKTVAFQRPD